MYTKVAIPIAFRSVVFNLFLTLQISFESFRLESFRIAFLLLLFNLSHEKKVLNSDIDKIVI